MVINSDNLNINGSASGNINAVGVGNSIGTGLQNTDRV
jgi:hypothetical protein